MSGMCLQCGMDCTNPAHNLPTDDELIRIGEAGWETATEPQGRRLAAYRAVFAAGRVSVAPTPEAAGQTFAEWFQDNAEGNDECDHIDSLKWAFEAGRDSRNEQLADAWELGYSDNDAGKHFDANPFTAVAALTGTQEQ